MGDTWVPTTASFTILGMTYSPGVPDKQGKQKFMEAYNRSGMIIGNLPMTVMSRVAAIGAIPMAAATYCPWNVHLEYKYITSLRKKLLQATMPYLVRGCRSAPIITTYFMKSHHVDPIIAPLMKMVKFTSEVGEPAAMAVAKAAEGRPMATSLATSLAAGLIRLGGSVSIEGWTTTQGIFVPFMGPTKHNAMTNGFICGESAACCFRSSRSGTPA